MNTNIIAVRQSLVDKIIASLGGNEMEIELSEESVQLCIDLALDKLKQRSDSSLEESLILLTLIKNQREYILPNEVADIERIYRKGFGRNLGSINNFDPFYYSGWNNIFSCSVSNAGRCGGLVTFELSNNYLKTCAKMFGGYMNYSYNPNTHKLVIVENPRSDNEVILLHSYTEKPDYELLQDRYSGMWLYRWALAEAKDLLGELRGRFTSGLPSAMSGTVNQNAQQLKTEAKAEKEALDKELMSFTAGGFVPSIFHG